ncbi:MAG: glycosyltransferase [Cetobacterium sp.]|uniref:glycosyltransferase n=1 Tax=Cetobacterium sp. TaxID=2071632 RepID=UPI003F3CBFCB
MNIIINNPAAKSSGALTILLEFIKKISLLTCNNTFYIFVTLKELKKYETKKIKIIVIPSQNFKERIKWDNYNLKRYLKKKSINPDIFISLQNTGVNLPKQVKQIIYYHQLLPLSDFKWSLFNSLERQFWIYKNIYPLFISQYLNRANSVIVQTNWVKELFSKKFKYPLEKIIVVKPEISLPNKDKINKISKDKFRIFYPSTPFLYKNHKTILKALKILKKENNEILDSIECIFTFSEQEASFLVEIIKKYCLEDTVRLIGVISYEKILRYYSSSDLIVFPSFIETLGLPLLEAKNFNLEILASDLPYSKEALLNYEKVEFLDYKKSDIWALKIKEKFLKTKKLK